VQVPEVADLGRRPRLQRLPVQPAHVVLPAVEVGLAVARVGRGRHLLPDLEVVVEDHERLDRRRQVDVLGRADRPIVPFDLLEELEIGLVDAVLDLPDQHLSQLLVPLHQRRLAALRRGDGVAVAVVRQRDRRADDGGEDQGQDQRDARALPGHAEPLALHRSRARENRRVQKTSMAVRTMRKIERHFFVCENARPAEGRPSCGARGSGRVTAALQEAVGARPELWGRVAVTPAGCLGPCFEGPVVVVYPEGVWYVGVREEDAAEIAETHMVAGRPVTRLLREED
jgi:(2Fe-2S) ferredoxin